MCFITEQRFRRNVMNMYRAIRWARVVGNHSAMTLAASLSELLEVREASLTKVSNCGRYILKRRVRTQRTTTLRLLGGLGRPLEELVDAEPPTSHAPVVGRAAQPDPHEPAVPYVAGAPISSWEIPTPVRFSAAPITGELLVN